MSKKNQKKRKIAKKRVLLSNVFQRFAILSIVLIVIFAFFLSFSDNKSVVLGVKTTSEEEIKDELEYEEEDDLEKDGEQVDCIGPDNKHFVTSFELCKEFNKEWGNHDFEFIKLESEDEEISEEEKEDDSDDEKTEEIEVKKHKKIEKTEVIKDVREPSKSPKKSELKNNSVVKIENHEGEVKKMIRKSDNNVTQTKIKSNNVEASTDLKVNVSTDSSKISVITNSGEHDIKILPSLAVQNLLTLDVISSVKSLSNQDVASSDSSINTINLTEIDDNPVFEIEGVLEKKVLGFFPVAFNKKVYVSVDNGKIVKTDETITDKILQVISF